MNHYNVSLAAMLRTLADYVEMSEGNVKLRIGVQFKLKNMSVTKIPVLPADKFGATLASWASREVIATVKRYQKATGRSDGQDVIDQFSQAHEYMLGLTK